MAIVVLEEMLGGVDEVKEALDQAITVLTDLVEECDPALVPHLPEVLDRTLLHPLTAHRAAVEHLLADAGQAVLIPQAQAQQRASRASLPPPVRRNVCGRASPEGEYPFISK